MKALQPAVLEKSVFLRSCLHELDLRGIRQGEITLRSFFLLWVLWSSLQIRTWLD